MLIHSASELKAILLPKIEQAVKQTEEQVHQIIDEYLKAYYSEYSPDYYHRTYQLLHSLVKSEIIATGNGYKGEVYYDVGSLGYKASWSGEQTMANAGTGKHATYPRYIGGTAIWDTPRGIISAEAIQMLVANLKAAGSPIK